MKLFTEEDRLNLYNSELKQNLPNIQQNYQPIKYQDFQHLLDSIMDLTAKQKSEVVNLIDTSITYTKRVDPKSLKIANKLKRQCTQK